jgi:hypothetical protein
MFTVSTPMFQPTKIDETKAIILNFSTSNVSNLSKMLSTSLGFNCIWQAEDGLSHILHNPTLSKDLLLFLTQSDSHKEPLSEEHLLVFYLNDEEKFHTLCGKLYFCGAEKVAAFNPYWDLYGTTFLLPDQFRIVLCKNAYSRYNARIAMPSHSLNKAQFYFETELKFKKIAAFENHAGFDGIILSTGKIDCHLELTYYHSNQDAQEITMPVSEDRFSVGLIKIGEVKKPCENYHDGQGHYVKIWADREEPWIAAFLKQEVIADLRSQNRPTIDP